MMNIPPRGSRMKRSAMLRSSYRIGSHSPEQQVKQKMAALELDIVIHLSSVKRKTVR
ncbi:MAG: hypothetical protein Q8M95_14555 [Candidatus Methanoperedens sp.]|nr:hypothetical protein [Candidatus Methanoperedens sp.]